MFIATLVADRIYADSGIRDCLDALRNAGCAPAEPRWIDEGLALDLPFADDPSTARTVLEGAGEWDVIVQPLANREKKLLVADMDSTMITVECIDELADYAGLKPQIAAVTEAAMRGELDFGAALDARVALLKGLDEGAIDRCLAERVRMMPGARELVRTMRARGALTVLVSGGFTRFAEPVAAELGFERVIANRLGIADGVLDGTVAKPIVDSATKEAALLAGLAERGLRAEQSLAVGDGANDLAMIRAAGLGVAYHAKPVVAAGAGARVDRGDLRVLLWAQGIARSEWAN